MKKNNLLFLNKKAVSLSANKLVSLILLVIVIIVLFTYSSNLNKTGSSHINTMLSPYQEIQCNNGFFHPPINCDNQLCTTQEQEIWEEIKKKFENSYQCDIEKGCSCVEKELIDIVSNNNFNLIDTSITVPAQILSSRLETINNDIDSVNITIDFKNNERFRFEFENNNWKLGSSNSASNSNQNLINEVVNSNDLYKGIIHIRKEFEKENSPIEKFRVYFYLNQKSYIITLDYLHTSKKILYQFNYVPTQAEKANPYFSQPQGSSILITKNNNDDDYIIQNTNGDAFKDIDSIEVSCNQIKFQQGNLEIYNLNNFDIMCDLQTFDFKSIKEFAIQYSIDINNLFTILDVESNNKFFYDDGHPVVRFECLRFNRETPANQNVPCKTDEKNKFGIQEHTDYNAFKRALSINQKQTLLQTSFGVAQVMGFHYENQGFKTVEEFYQSMFSQEGQILAYLKYLSQTKPIILTELQKENPDWRTIAYNYNGEDYEKNNYHIKLKEANEKRKSQIS